MANKPQPIFVRDINLGGLAESLYQGPPNSVYRAIGLDLHSEPGVVKVNQKPTKVADGIIDELTIVKGSTDGNTYFFSTESGKIWKYNGSTYSLAHTTTPSTGEAKCLGAIEFDGYLYWATQDYLHRISVTATSDWSNAEEDFAELHKDQEELNLLPEQTTTLATSIAETATDKLTLRFHDNVQSGIKILVDTVGTGNWTVTLHDSGDNVIASKTISNGSMTTGQVLFEFASDVEINPDDQYHYHVTSTVADGIVETTTASDLSTMNAIVYTRGDNEYHPLIIQNGDLYIGDRNYIHKVTESAEESTLGTHLFIPWALDIKKHYRITCFAPYSIAILIGTIINNGINKTEVLEWSTWSISYTSSDPIEETGIRAFINGDNYVYAIAGDKGRIYQYNGGYLIPYKTLPFDFYNTSKITARPNATSNYKGLPLFGLSNVSGNPIEQGVYSLGSPRTGYPPILNFDYPISKRSSGEFVMEYLTIESIEVVGTNIWISWKYDDGVTPEAGVDLIDWNTKLEKGYFETRRYRVSRYWLDKFKDMHVAYSDIPEDTDIKLYYKNNYAANWTEQELVLDTQRMVKKAENAIEASTMQYKIEIETDTNSTPKFEELILTVI